MKKKAYYLIALLLTICFLLLAPFSGAQLFLGQKKAAELTGYHSIFTITFSEQDIQYDTYQQYDILSLDTCNWINEPGNPMLPTKEIQIAVPSNILITDITILDVQQQQINQQVLIIPAQPPRRTDGSMENTAFVQPNALIYNSNKLYPETLVELGDQSDLAGQALITVHINPMQYTPKQKTISLITSITFGISGKPGYICGDYLPRTISERGQQTYENMITSLVINPKDVLLTTETLEEGTPMTFDLPSGGPYDYVIIGVNSDSTYWQPLINWRTQHGMKATYVTTTYIYSNYAGSDNQQKIRNFVIDARNNWGTLYFLIAGENGDVPFEYRTYEGDSIPSDQYYGDYDDDWDYEVYVGRVTASSSTEIDTFIDKILVYEKNPPMTNYILDIALLGMDVTTVAYDGYLTRGQYCKNTIDGYIPSQFTVDKIYDTDASNHLDDFIDALDDGQNLVNHYDHSGATVLGCGDRNHGDYMDRTDVNYLTNNNKMSNIFSIGCHANELDYNDCIAERFVIFNPLQAGISFTGNTRSGWFYVGDPDSLSGELDKDWWSGLFNQNKYILGETLAYTKNVNSYSSEVWKYCQWTLNLLGDPAMPLWTDDPIAITATYPSEVPVGSSQLTVNSNSGYSTICLWKDDEVYEVGEANSAGDYTFSINPSTTGTLLVTITNQNYIPYEGIATVISPPEYTLTITIDPVGSGTVTRNPDQPTYTYGQIVQLNANPATGWSFDHWSGALAGSTNPTTISMDSDKTLTSHFTQLEYTVTTTVEGEGQIIVTPDQPTYHYGDSVELYADSEEGWYFNEWSGDVSGTINPKQLTILDDISVTASFLPGRYILDLINFPMYQAQGPNYNEYCGPAVAQMTLDYIWWNQTRDPETPAVFDDQSLLYEKGLENNTDPALTYLDAQGLWKLLQGEKPGPYSEYGYNFVKKHTTDLDTILKQICAWIDYPIGTFGGYKEGYQTHVPGLVPAYGDYSNWMAIRGIHTDQHAYPIPDELTVYGFWVNDPLPGGIGENSYKTIDTWIMDYYQTLTSNDDYNGEYVAICEPPETTDVQELILVHSPTRFNSQQQTILNYLQQHQEKITSQIRTILDKWVIQAATKGITEQLLEYDRDLSTIFSSTTPGIPIHVDSLNDQDYYLVPFEQPKTQKTVIVVRINADTGQFLEASWVQQPVTYLPVSQSKAEKIVTAFLEKEGMDIPDQYRISLVHRSSSPYLPEWQFFVDNDGLYVNQQGIITQ